MKKLYIMSGCPGSGKTTFATKYLKDENTYYISRDEIRFAIVPESDPYFSRENLVFNEFIKQINEKLSAGYNVIADATHLNSKSRSKLLFRLVSNLNNTEVIVVFMQTPLETCVERNSQRQGTRAYVPYKEVCKMYRAVAAPTFTECNHMIDLIYTITPDNIIKITSKKGNKDGLFHF